MADVKVHFFCDNLREPSYNAFIMDMEKIRDYLSKSVDDEIKSMYAGTCTSGAPSADFTMDTLREAMIFLKDMPPAPPDFVYSPHLGDDDAYEMTGTVIPFFKNGVVFVGSNVRDELIKKGLPVIEFNKRRDENDETPTNDQENRTVSD